MTGRSLNQRALTSVRGEKNSPSRSLPSLNGPPNGMASTRHLLVPICSALRLRIGMLLQGERQDQVVVVSDAGGGDRGRPGGEPRGATDTGDGVGIGQDAGPDTSTTAAGVLATDAERVHHGLLGRQERLR